MNITIQMVKEIVTKMIKENGSMTHRDLCRSSRVIRGLSKARFLSMMSAIELSWNLVYSENMTKRKASV